MALSDIVADFLQSEDSSVSYALGKLEFWLDGFQVDREGYREIGSLIRIGDICVAVGSRSANSPTDAVYTSRRNRLSVPANLSLTGSSGAAVIKQAMIVHECTHALMDFHKYQTTGTLQEVAAYVAGTLYAAGRMVRMSDSKPATKAILDAAYAIVRDRSMVNTRNVRLSSSDTDVAALATAITAHPAYLTAGAMDTVDGINTTLINPWYQPRN